MFGAGVVGLLVGDGEDLWGTVGIVENSSAKALIEIASTPEFRTIEVHRLAGLEGQLNITTQEQPFG